MNLKERINSDMKAALKSGDRESLDTLRMLRSKILEKEVELRSKKGRDYELDDEETLEVITQYAKQRRQSIEAYREGGRDDLAKKEESELRLLDRYLPEQLSEEQVETMIEEVIAETGASGPGDIGTVMKALMPKVKGAADGKVVNEMVRRKLGAGS